MRGTPVNTIYVGEFDRFRAAPNREQYFEWSPLERDLEDELIGSHRCQLNLLFTNRTRIH